MKKLCVVLVLLLLFCGCQSVADNPTTPPTTTTTGAGDTFNGVLAACIANGMDLRKACKKANLAAGIKVTRKYILDSIPFKEEVEKIGEKNRD